MWPYVHANALQQAKSISKHLGIDMEDLDVGASVTYGRETIVAGNQVSDACWVPRPEGSLGIVQFLIHTCDVMVACLCVHS
jgi:hypothetical protein